MLFSPLFFFFFFNDTATTEIYTLSLHDALPIYRLPLHGQLHGRGPGRRSAHHRPGPRRSEEHTSELQSRLHLVCRLLLEKKKKNKKQENLKDNKKEEDIIRVEIKKGVHMRECIT